MDYLQTIYWIKFKKNTIVFYLTIKLAGKPVAEVFHISSTIANHFSKTVLYGAVYNPSPEFQQLSFTFFLPDSTLITNLTMTSEGEDYVSTLQDTYNTDGEDRLG